MKNYSILQVCEDVADSLRQFRVNSSHDLPMIREAIKDRIDSVDREGFKVREFDQEKAVRRVRLLLR